MPRNTDIQTGDVFENDYMKIVVTEATDEKITYSAGSVNTTKTVLRVEFELKIMNKDFEKIGTQNVSQNAKVAKPNPDNDDDETTTEQTTRTRSRRSGTRRMVGKTQFHDRSTETAMDGRGPRSW